MRKMMFLTINLVGIWLAIFMLVHAQNHIVSSGFLNSFASMFQINSDYFAFL